MTSARSSSFLKPAKAMLVPFTYSLGLASHANMVSLFHSTSAFFKTLVNLKSLADAAFVPMIPYRFGPCFVPPPACAEWQVAHLALKSLAPFLASPLSILNSLGPSSFTSTHEPLYGFIFFSGVGAGTFPFLDVSTPMV